MLNGGLLARFKQVAVSWMDGFATGGGREVAIIITQVDPDALGAAYALREILIRLGVVTDKIYYGGHYGHPQNRAIINRFNLTSLLMPAKCYDKTTPTALVDSSSYSDGRIPESCRPIRPKIVIDHHDGGAPTDDPEQFFWVERVGASCTMLVELAGALEIELSPAAAMMLALGIYTDTHSLVGASERDRMAFGKMTEKIDPSEFKRLVDYSLPESFFRNLGHALSHLTQKDSRLVASLGRIEESDGDDVSSVSDLLIRRLGTSLVVTWAIIGDKFVRISARSNDPSIILDAELKRWFGNANAGAKVTPNGHGEGGAVIMIDLGFWASEASKDKIDQVVSLRINELVLE